MSKLYVVATPIGNLKDITLRALEVLKEVDIILCEDTRTTGILLKHYEITDKRLISYHKFNEYAKIDIIVDEINKGTTYAIVSDAGTPLISDPGQLLVKRLIELGIKVESVPGPSSLTTALSISGFEFSNFTFVGFLEKTPIKLQRQIDMFKQSDLIVAFESPHRINKTLELLHKIYGDIEVAIVREISKKFETVHKGNISTLLNKEYKGEIVLIIKI